MPVHGESRKGNRNYSSVEKEALAIAWAVRVFRPSCNRPLPLVMDEVIKELTRRL